MTLKGGAPCGPPSLMRPPEVFLIDDKAGKPVGIQKFIGGQPDNSNTDENPAHRDGGD